jgi:hypothetical protein
VINIKIQRKIEKIEMVGKNDCACNSPLLGEGTRRPVKLCTALAAFCDHCFNVVNYKMHTELRIIE